MEQWTPLGKQQKLRGLYREWRECEACRLHEERTNVCFGNGNQDADIMMIGEAPGEHEDETGNVFVGEAGLLLDAILKAAKIRRDDVFLTNLVMCRPPGNRNPTKDERAACFDRLYWQIYTVDPMLIMPIGKAAMEALMGGKWKSITQLHGKIGYIEVPGQVEDVVRYPAMPVLHPSFINREDKINRDTKNWEQGGWASKTFKDFVRARQRVEWLHKQYEPAARSLSKVTSRRGLRVVQ
jgi:uracil-DNA glycosylase family 4